ncbi:unnamed protein product [Nesidiocoris tenuis]|uniref:Uncharacterized protein n=1 Tax=Nesidiocoris tenuis TaxID=355587 RepID=A0A6H5GAI7_9HEMI|nr:unnamed protein product [Nesidiocoris tenuis]
MDLLPLNIVKNAEGSTPIKARKNESIDRLDLYSFLGSLVFEHELFHSEMDVEEYRKKGEKRIVIGSTKMENYSAMIFFNFFQSQNSNFILTNKKEKCLCVVETSCASRSDTECLLYAAGGHRPTRSDAAKPTTTQRDPHGEGRCRVAVKSPGVGGGGRRGDQGPHWRLVDSILYERENERDRGMRGIEWGFELRVAPLAIQPPPWQPHSHDGRPRESRLGHPGSSMGTTPRVVGGRPARSFPGMCLDFLEE